MGDPEIDTSQLRQLLNRFSKELQVTFLDRRDTANLHKDNPLNELQDVISEVADREKQLQAAVGIAKMLLDSNEKLGSQVDSMREKKRRKMQQAQLLTQEMETLKEELITSKTKYQQVVTVLTETEEKLLTAGNQNNWLITELKAKATPAAQIDRNDSETELDQLKSAYKEQFTQLHKGKMETEREKKELHGIIKILEDLLNGTSREIKDHEIQSTIHSQKQRALEQEVSSLKTSLMVSEENSKTAKLMHTQTVRELKRLKEEIYLLENNSPPYSSPVPSNCISLQQELPSNCISLKEELHSNCISLKEELPSNCISLKGEFEFFAGLTVASFQQALIPSEKRNPCEEYFILATQSVKMNSTYLDAICTVPTEVLYQKVLDSETPFHKWYSWIEEELNNACIQTLDSMNNNE